MKHAPQQVMKMLLLFFMIKNAIAIKRYVKRIYVRSLLQRASVQVFHQQMCHGCSLTTDWGDYQPKGKKRERAMNY
jgi:hypothetical protein